MKKTFPIAFVAATLQFGCAGDFWFDFRDESRSSSLGTPSGSLFAISPEEGLLSHPDDDVAMGHARDIRGIGARMIRLQFCDFVADDGKIDPGQLARLHRMVDVAKDAGLEIYAELNYCSVVPRGYGVQEWHDVLNARGNATRESQKAWHDGFDDSGTGNQYARDFADATRAFAQELGDEVDYWEIWNEPNAAPDTNWDDACTSGKYGVAGGGINWSLCPKQLGVITRKAFEVLTEEDPGARVVAGNVLFHGDNYWVAKEYWEAVYESAAVREFRNDRGQYPWDVVGFHPYGVPAYAPDDDPQNGLREQVEDFRRYLASDDSARLAITEHGWTTNLNHADKRVSADAAHQAYQVREVYPLAAELGLELVMWFNMRDAAGGGYYFGLQLADGNYKPAATAYCEVSRASSCPAGSITPKPGTAGRVGSRPNGVTDPAIDACQRRNGATGKPLDNGGGPHVHRWGRGWVQDYRDPNLGDTICMRKDNDVDAWMVRGAIRDTYFRSGGGPGKLGYPLEDEHPSETGPYQAFENGYITWSHGDGAFVARDYAGNRL